MGKDRMCAATGYSDQVPAQGVAGWGSGGVRFPTAPGTPGSLLLRGC